MPSDTEFQAALERVESYLRDLEDDIVERRVEDVVVYEDSEENEYSFTGIRCAHEDTHYIVAGHPDFRFMGVIHFISITEFIASGLDRENTDMILDEDIGEDTSANRLAARQLLNDVDEESMETVKSYIHFMISGENHVTEFQLTDGDAIDYITTERKLFPYEDNFGIQDLYDATVSIVNSGERANRLIPRTIGLSIPESEDEDHHLNFNLDW